MKQDQEEYFVDLGKIVRRVREEQGLSQQELANRCNVERAKISMIENGRLHFRHYTIVEVAKGLGVDVRDLLPTLPKDSK